MTALSLSTTGFADAAQCLKKYRYHFVEKLVQQPRYVSRAVRRGIWTHRCLQDYHCGRYWLRSLQALHQQALGWGLDPEEVQKIHDEVLLLVQGYSHFWGAEDWEILADEKEYRHTFGDIELRARLDMLARVPGYGLCVVEHKTTSDVPAPSWRAIDPQTALQVILLQANGITVDGILFNYIDTTPTVPRVTGEGKFYKTTATTTSAHFEQAVQDLRSLWGDGPEGTVSEKYEQYFEENRKKLVLDEKYYQRYFVQRSTSMLRETLADVAGIVDNIRRAERREHYPRSLNVATCKRFCFYGELCATEYVKGGPSEALREARYQHDDGYREGNVT